MEKEIRYETGGKFYQLAEKGITKLYDLFSPKVAFDGSRRSKLLDKTSEFPLEVIDTRKK